MAALRRQEERGQVSLADYFESDGHGGYQMRPLEDLTPALRRGLREIEFRSEVVQLPGGTAEVVTRIKRIRCVDAIRADEIVLRSQGLLAPDGAGGVQIAVFVVGQGDGGEGEPVEAVVVRGEE